MIAKKTIILYVLQAFEYSNEPINLLNLTKALNARGIVCDRKTVGRNVKYLIEFGVPIVKEKRGYYYLKNEDEQYQYLLKR